MMNWKQTEGPAYCSRCEGYIPQDETGWHREGQYACSMRCAKELDEPIIVSRHPSIVEFIRKMAGLGDDVRVISRATAQDVRGRVVYGNLPLALAALAKEVVSVQFAFRPLRDTEYSLQQMVARGGHLKKYRVEELDYEGPSEDGR